jgi:hypothetical protein
MQEDRGLQCELYLRRRERAEAALEMQSKYMQFELPEAY